MLNLLLSAGLAAFLLGSWVTARNIDRVPRQLSGGQYINDTQFGNISTSVQLDISINGGGRNKTAPLLYGWMFEDISRRATPPHVQTYLTREQHSGDGGIYAEMLVNRAFQGSGPIIGPVPGIAGSSIQSSENPILPFGPVGTGWRAVGNVSLSLTLLHPLSEALPVVLEMGTSGAKTRQDLLTLG